MKFKISQLDQPRKRPVPDVAFILDQDILEVCRAKKVVLTSFAALMLGFEVSIVDILYYIILNNGILKSNSTIFPRSKGYITQYTP